MQFSELVSVAPHVHFTCFIYDNGKFRQWEPTKVRKQKGITYMDQLGSALIESKANVLTMRVYRVQPTANNYMNVYLY
jgi:hypothetical protein